MDRALAVDRVPTYQREPTGSSFDAFAAQVRVLLAVTPAMPAATAAERVGWSSSASLFPGEGLLTLTQNRANSAVWNRKTNMLCFYFVVLGVGCWRR